MTLVSTDILIPSREPIRTYGGLHPLSNEHRQVEVPAGATMAEALEMALAGTGVDWPRDHFVAMVNDVRVPREYWERVRPKPGTIVVFRPVASGGGSTRSLLFLGVAIAALFLAPAIGGLFAAGSFFASSAGIALIGGVITIGGALLLNALIPLRPAQQDTGQVNTLPMISGAQNEARPWGTVPVVLGTHRLSPMYAAMPYTFFSGEKQFINMIFCCGYGPVGIWDTRIGETPIGEFEEMAQETYEGRPGDPAITLFPSIANEQNLGITLLSVDSFVSRTTADNCSTISIDLIAPNGIYSYNSSTGGYDDRPVTITVQYTNNINAGWISRPNIVFTRTRDTVRKGDQWNVPPGTYLVRLAKITADYVGTGQVADTIEWITLRAFETGQPIKFPKPLGLIGIRARGSNQFNGVINTINCIVSSYVKSWNGSVWVDNQHSSNPADLFRHVLQGPANARPRTDAQIDLSSIQLWADDCRARGYTYNAIISDQRTVREVLSDIAAAGRATVALRNGKWGVAFPRNSDPVSWHFTPRNSSGMKTTRVYHELPHALRVRYIEASSGWKQVEKIVYNDVPNGGGTMYNEATATLFESVEFPGITDWENIHKAARYQLAQVALRPETHTLTADVESLRLERGDKVIMSNDVLLIGTGYGRVTSVDAIGQTVHVDSRVIMAVGKSYQIKFTLSDGTFLTRTVLNTANETDWIKLDVGSSTMPPVGALFSFGETTKVTADYRVLDVRPGPDLSAQFVLVDDAPGVEFLDPIPPYNPGITEPPDPFNLSPESLTWNERFSGSGIEAKATMLLTVQVPRAGTIRAFEFQYLDITTNGTWTPFAVISAPLLTASKDNLEAGTYNFRVRSLFSADPNDQTSATQSSKWIYSGNVNVLSTDSPPPNLDDSLVINISGSLMLLQWSQSTAINVASYRVKYNPAVDGSATWGNSMVLATTPNNNATAPTRSGTYMVKAVTYSGVESAVELQHIVVTSPPVPINIVSDFDDAPATPIFPGTHYLTQVQGGVILTLAFQPSSTNYVLGQGFYQFKDFIDLGTVYTSRISARISAYGIKSGDTMDHWMTLAGVVALDTTDPSQWSVETVYAASNGPQPKSIIQRITDLGLTSGLKLCLEASALASWPGTGQTWLDESGGGYDFFLGTDALPSDNDPAPPPLTNSLLRTGGGSWYFDGDAYFTYDSVNETWMNAIHQNNAQFTIVASFFMPALDTSGVGHYLMGDTLSGTQVGFQLMILNNRLIFLTTNGAIQSYGVSSSSLLTAAGWHTVGISIDESTGLGTIVVDGVAQALSGIVYNAPSAAIASWKLQVAAVGNGAGALTAGWYLHAVAAWQGVALTSAQLVSMVNAVQHNDDWIFGPWTPYTVNDVTARIIAFGVRLNGKPDGSVSPAITKLGVTIDMPDRHLGFDIGPPGSGTSESGYQIFFNPPFKKLKSIALANYDLDTANAEHYDIVSKSESQVTIKFSKAGAAISKTFSLHAYGYGAVVS